MLLDNNSFLKNPTGSKCTGPQPGSVCVWKGVTDRLVRRHSVPPAATGDLVAYSAIVQRPVGADRFEVKVRNLGVLIVDLS